MLRNALQGAAITHKNTAREFIYSSNKEISFNVVLEPAAPTVGSSMFGDLTSDNSSVREVIGPFKCIWVDADSARARENSREASFLRRHVDATVVAKVWLGDVLIDPTNPYGETLLDRSEFALSDLMGYQIMGYDRYGLGVTDPYILAIALRGSYADEQPTD